MNMERDAIKAMIELSDTWQEADKIIVEFTSFTDPVAKRAYLSGMFNVSILGAHDEGKNEAENDYIAVLSAIVNKKWR